MHNSCTVSTSISIPNHTYLYDYMPDFLFTTEILDVILRLHSANLVVAIMSKGMGYMLG